MAQLRFSILGTGKMGLPLTEHLLNGGYTVSAWNRTAEKLHTIKDPKRNLRISKSPVEAIRSSTVVISSLFNAKQFHDILDSIKPEDFKNKTFISIMTISPEESLSFNTKVTKFGGEYIETPLIGNSEVAKKAALQVIVGSTKEQYDRFVSVFSLWGTPRYIGPVGHAAKTKLAVNSVLASLLAGYTSSYAYLESNSVDTAMFTTILTNGPLNTSYPYYSTWQKKINGKDYDDVAFSLSGMHKDVGLMLKEAQKSHIDATHIEGTFNVYDQAMKENEHLKEKDFSSVYEKIKAKL